MKMENIEENVCGSIGELIDVYSDMVYRVILQHMRNEADAQDVLQDVFIKVMKGMPTFETRQKEKAWMLRVAINTCKDRWKYDRLRRHEELFENDAIQGIPQTSFNILPYVLKLPQKYRDVIYLFYYEEYSVKEIASILQKKEATILTWLRRARICLKDDLEGSEWCEEI